MKIGRSAWLFPASLAILLGGLSAWLESVSNIEIEEVALNPNEPQYAIEVIDGKRFDEHGKVKEWLTADKAWQLPNSQEVVLSQPKMRLFAQGKPTYQVRSNEAVYHTEQRQVIFEQDVVLDKVADGNGAAGQVRTNKITVDTQSQVASTQELVHFNYGGSEGSAKGFRYEHKDGKLNLPDRVKAIIYDPKKPS